MLIVYEGLGKYKYVSDDLFSSLTKSQSIRIGKLFESKWEINIDSHYLKNILSHQSFMFKCHIVNRQFEISLHREKYQKSKLISIREDVLFPLVWITK